MHEETGQNAKLSKPNLSHVQISEGVTAVF
jgi:hypothetical protein